jgi:ABC-type branched-subunit amino acid transport system substrate-binding protein
MQKSARVVVFFAVAATIGLAACSSSGGSSAARSGSDPVPGSSSGNATYSIGAVAPLSGTNEVYGQQVEMASNLAATNLNAASGLGGALKMHYVDSQSDPGQSVLGLQRLISQNGILAATTLISSNVKAEAPAAERAGIPLLNTGGSSSDLVGIGKTLINLLPLGTQQLPALIPYVIQQKSLKRIAAIYSSDTLGDSMKSPLTEQVAKSGAQLVGSATVSATQTEFASTVAQIRQLKPDAVFLATSNAQALPTLIRELRDGGVTGQLISYSGTVTPALLKEPTAEGMIFTAQAFDFSGKSTDPPTAEFVTTWKRTYPSVAMTDTEAVKYNAVLMVAAAIKGLVSDHQNVTSSAILSEIHKIGSFDLVGGQTKVNSDGTIESPLTIDEIHNGEEVTLKTVPISAQ